MSESLVAVLPGVQQFLDRHHVARSGGEFFRFSIGVVFPSRGEMG